LPGGEFRMGDAFGEGYPEDGEGPVRTVRAEPFRIDATPSPTPGSRTSCGRPAM
jgi:formylglycine-generating enzyme required for sulfatase activity